MTELTKPRYRVLQGFKDFEEFERRINIASDLGYTAVFAGTNGEGGLWALMKIENGNYQDVTNLKDVEPTEVDGYIAEGWEITSTSISTKFIRMVKRKTSEQ